MKTSILNVFGTNAKFYRKIKNLTQEKLAEMIDINTRQLARIEAGESFVSFNTLTKLCSALDVKPSFLFEEFKTFNSENKIFRIAEKIRVISKDKAKLRLLEFLIATVMEDRTFTKLKDVFKI